MKITTNNRERELVSFVDLPEKEQDWFDYVEGEDRYADRFFRFRDSWWDSHEFERAPDEYRAQGWDGVFGTSYFDAVVLRYFDREGNELEGVVVGHATW